VDSLDTLVLFWVSYRINSDSRKDDVALDSFLEASLYQKLARYPWGSTWKTCRTISGFPALHFHSYTVARPVTAAGMLSAVGLVLQKSSIPAVGTLDVSAFSWQGRLAPK
jgi:hypothetical protein